jgi:hypothetical protein
MSSTIIRHKRSAIPGKIPQASQLEPGELAINTADGKIFLKKDDNTVTDVTQGIFQNNTSVTVTDENDSSQGIVSIVVDGSEKVNITDASINLKDSVVIENENTLTFRENVGGGLEGVSIKAPNNLVSSYSLTLPTNLGPAGSLIGTDENGELYFSSADIYGGKNIFVSSENGDDANDGINLPVRSVKRACQLASEMVYNIDSTVNGTRVTIKVAAGDYSENNPIIVPDNVVIKGDGLRGCIIRPQNANQDMLRVRNGSYFAEFTFRDAIDENFVPLYTFDYAVAFDDPDDVTVSRTGYTYLPDTKPTIASSPYVQNCSLISFLGGNGAKIDGSKVNSPNIPNLQIEVENPVVGPAPEQGKSMVSNAFTMLSFGGTGWRLINDAYAQIVSCFQIFMLNGVYTQSGGYCSITNSATNFGLYALRSSGYSSRTFNFDRGYVFSTGISSGAQTITVVGVNRSAPVEEFVLRFREPEYKIAYDLIESEKNTIADDTISWINTQISTATPGSLWYNFTYTESVYRAAFLIILDAVANDTWSTGNAASRQVTLSYFSNRLGDSSSLTISEQEDQFTAAIERLSVHTAGSLSSLDSTVRSFVDEKFDLIKNGISEPNTIPQPFEVSSEGDISNDYKSTGTEVTFNAATAVNASLDIITINGHGLTNGQAVIYDNNGNTSIGGLDPEQTYYVKYINDNEFSLTFDNSLEFNVNIRSTSTGTHKFVSNVPEFYVNDVISSHTSYQTLILQSGSESYNFVPGRAITGTTGANNNSAIVYSWKPADRELIVSVELVTVGASTQRVQFDETSSIDSDHSVVPNTNIGVNEAAAKTGLSTSTFTVGSTIQGGQLTNLINLLEKQIWFHRPSIVNSSSHTWEYAGSGIDYNALPQNGGNTREAFEQYQELPGRVYTSGTNELGDFKVGNFITAFNRTGNITFRNKVTVDELDVLRLAFSDIVIEEISTDTNLGDDELGGSSNSRLSTQLAIRSFLSNRLGGFIDKTVSTAAVPGAIVQLNTNGQLNAELIPATRQFTSTTTNGYLSKLLQVDEIPAVDLKAGDIATEEYEQIELTLSGNITAADGDTITQPSTGAIGYVKGDFSNSPTVIVASIDGEFKAGDDSTGTDFDTAGTIYVNAVSSGVYPTSLGTSAAITENFFLKSSNTSQYLVLSNDSSYTFTSASISNVSRSTNVATITTLGNHNLVAENTVQVICTSDPTFTVNAEVISAPTPTSFTIANTGSDTGSTAATGTVRTIVSSADGNAQGAVTETRYGVLTNVDNANITGGSSYTPASGSETYEFVALTSTTGVGTGAYADITVTAGQVTDVNLRRGGTGYAVGDTLSASAASIGGTGSGFEIEVSAIEKRAYVNILGGELFVASTSSVDFVEDNTAPASKKTVTLTSTVSNNFLAGDSGSGGNVNYTTNQITISSHGLSNGDPVKYDTLGNVAIGSLINGSVYYAKSINSNTIELYEDYSLLNKIEFTSTPANNNHNLTRFTVNVIDNSIVVPLHGFTTGSAVRFEGNDLFDISGTQVESGSRFFIGSVTTNSFTLHELRSEALSSINGLVTGAKNIDGVGTGTAIIYPQNVRVNSVVNTSSRIKANWNSLTASNIDASNIVSGTISPSRLASSGTANTDTFLRGDSSYQTVVQSLKKANTTDNPITLTGSSSSGEFYGDPVNIGIANVDLDVGQTYSTLGVARFLQSQFDVDPNATGQVFIKSGVIDAGTLDGLDSAYFLNPANLTSNVPVNRGGTNLSTYATGDIIYAQSSSTLGTLSIGRANSFLRSTGTIPEWSTALELAEGLDVGSARLSSSSVGIGTVYNENVTSLELGSNADNVKIGKSVATRAITSFVSGYSASISTTVAVNLASFTANTDAVTASGTNEVPMGSTSGILYGMLVTGSASIPANTTVTGVTADYIYLSNETTGTISNPTTLTFTYTPLTLGIRAGDTVNIASSGITNLDGQWHVLGATANANSFTIAVAASVTANPANPVAGSITKDNTIVIRNRNVIFGSAEASASPIAATIKGESGIGTNVAGGNFIIQGGLSTGNATGGSVIIKTGQTGSSGIAEQTSTTRLTIDTAGKATFTGEVGVASTLSTSESTVNVVNTTATTVNFAGAATALNLGAATGTTTVNNNLTVTGNLTVNGTTTTVNSTTISVDDKNIELGSVASPTDVTADGGGITLKGATDKTIVWDNANDNWTSSEHWNLVTGKSYKINNVSVLNSTTLGSSVVTSSLTSVGTIGTGTWQGTIIAGTYGGTGVNNGTKTITLGGNLVTNGAFTLQLTATNNTNVTLPTSGTLAVIGNPLSQFASTTSSQLAGVISDETGSGALVFGTSPTFSTSLLTDSTTLSVFNTTATTVNAFGAATVIAMGAASSMVTFGDDITVTGLTKATQGVQFGATDSLLYESASNVATIRIGADGPFVSFTDSGSNVATLSNASGALTIATGAGNGDITLSPNGTGDVVVSSGNFGVGRSDPQTKVDVIGSITARPAATQDGVILAGRAGGTSNYSVTITPTTLAANRTLTLADGNTTLQAGTMAITGGTLAQFASTTSAQLAGVISDETGSGVLVFGTSPTFTTGIDAASATMALFDTTATTVNAFGATTTLNLGYDSTAASTTNISTGAVANATTKTVNLGTGGAAGSTTNVNIGSSSGGTTTVNNNLVVSGNLTVDGTTTTVNSTTISVDDKNIELGSVASPTDVTADGGGITLKGATDKTLNWVNATDAWTSSEHFALAAGKTLLVSGSSSGTATITAPAAAGTPTLTLPSTTGTFARLEDHLGSFAATTSAQLAGVISDETGSGVLVFGTSPSFTTGINAASTTMALFDTTATTVNAFGDTTTLNLGYDSTAASTTNISTGAVANATTKTVNLGTGGAAGSTTNVNIGSSVGGTTTINSGTLVGAATTQNVFDTVATTINFAGAATTGNFGYDGTAASTTNISTGATGTGVVKTVNLGTGGAAGSTTNVNIGSSSGGTTTVNNDLTVTGNLTISGTTTVVNTETVTINDNIIVLNNNSASTPTENAGIEIERGASANVQLLWNESTDRWTFTNDGTTYFDIPTSSQYSVPNNGTLTLAVSGTGLSGSATFTADQSGNSTFTVTSNATNANTSGAIVARDGSGNFSAGTITAALSGNASTATTLQNARTINGVSFNGSANIAVPSLYDTNYRRITNPGGAEYVTTTATVTGAIEIVLPVGYTNSMMRMTVTIYEYVSGESFTVECGGYNYAATSQWINTFAYITGSPSVDRRFSVRFGLNAAGKAVVYIGELASTWSIPQVYVTDVQVGYGGQSATWVSGWAINFQSSAFENVTSTITNPQIGYAVSTNTANSVVLRDGSGNFSAGVITASLIGNAATASTLQTARNIAISGDITGTATSFNGSADITISAAITAGSIVNADINASAAIADTKLATISTAGKVANSATTATNANTASAIVARDASGNFSAGTITAALSGNASTATTAAAWTTGRTITLTGDVTGVSGSFDGSGNISFATTIAANSVELGTDTTGNYVAGLTAGNGISITGTAGEGWSPTVAMTGSYTGNFTATGEVTAYSDITLKDNIEVIADPLTKILKLRGVTFTRNDLEDKETRHMGVIAQEVEQYFPEVVHTTENGIKTVNYGAMAGAFIEAFKDQQRQIDELKALVQKLI